MFKNSVMNGNVYLEELLRGNSEVISKMYKINFIQIKNFVLLNRGNSIDAKDIFQKALLQIAVRHQKDGIKLHTSFSGFLFTVCKNLWRRELNNRKHIIQDYSMNNLVCEASDGARAIIEQKRHELFLEKLGNVSENCKLMLTMFFANISYKEIVSSTSYTSEAAVRQRIFKCKKKLKELIQKDHRFNTLQEL